MMKKTLFLLACFYYCTTVLWGQTIQQGIVYQYNGEKPRTPLANVTISCSSALNTNVLSEADGTFSLNFRDKRIGDPIGKVEIQKREMIVFNQAAVDEWSIRKETLVLIMCDKAEFDKEKQRLIDIGKRETEKRYNQRREELEAEYEKGRIAIKEKEERLNQMWEQMMRYHNNIDQYADIFVRIDLSETDSTSREAIRLFKMGRVDEAINMFESQDNMNRLTKENQLYKKIQDLEKKLEQSKETAGKKLQETIEALHMQADAYMIVNEWEKARAILKGLADEVGTKEELSKYAVFEESQQRLEEAAKYYLKSLALYRKDNKGCRSIDSLELSMAINDVARVYSHDARFLNESEVLFKEAISIRRQLIKTNPQQYAPNLAASLRQIAFLYLEMNRIENSEQYYKEAIALNRQYGDAEGLYLGLEGLGSLYKQQGDFIECENIYNEALCLADTLSGGLYASCLGNLSALFVDLHRYLESMDYGEKAVSYLRVLSKENSEKFEPSLAGVLNNLALTYLHCDKMEESYKLIKEAVDIQRRLVNSGQNVHGPQLVICLNTLSNICGRINKEEEGLLAQKEALETQRRLASLNPLAFNPMLAVSLYNYARIDNTNIDRDSFYEEAVAIQQHLVSNSQSEVYESRLATMEDGYARYLYNNHLNDKGEYFIKDAIVHFSHLTDKWPDVYAQGLANSYWYLALQKPREEKVQLFSKALSCLSRQTKQEDSKDQMVFTLSNMLAYNLLFLKRFEEAESYAKVTREKYPENLAASLLFQGKYFEAEEIYLQYKDELAEIMLEDLRIFEEAGIIDDERKEDLEKIRKILLKPTP